MKRWKAVGIVAGLAAATLLSLTLPPFAVAALAVASLAAMRRRRVPFLAFAATTLVLGTLILALFQPGTAPYVVGPLRFGQAGAWTGFVGALRLVALLGINFATLSWISAVRLLDGLRLPARATALAAAVLIGAHDVGEHATRLAAAARLEHAPAGHGRLRTLAASMPSLLVASLGRAQTRRDALLLAGHPMPPGFVPVVAVSALALAGQLALAPFPNLKPTYLIVFLGGLAFGWRLGALAGLLAMVCADLVLSALVPEAFVNAPAMAVLGLLGGACRRIDFAGPSRIDRAAGRLLAGTIGIAATLAFSILADAATWLVIPDFRNAGTPALVGLIATGLAFNVVPAAANGVLFAAAVAPVQATLRATGWGNRIPHGPASGSVP